MVAADARGDNQRELDVVLFGATGYVGRLIAGYLAGHAPAGVRIGLAGRSAARLAAVRDSLGPAAAGWPVLTADTTDAASLAGLAASTRVLATTVGPYARYGLPVVEACARAGTDYLDLTGEVLFVRDSIDRYQDLAVHSGARIVHSCGYDSIPSDLGVLLLHQRAAADAGTDADSIADADTIADADAGTDPDGNAGGGGGHLTDTTLVATSRGGFSGGTIDSVRAEAEATGADPSLRRVRSDPYALSPDRAAEPDLGPQPDRAPIHRDPQSGRWTGPFVMAAYNSRIVRRSNALLDWAYGRSFRYREVMSFGSGPAAPIVAAVTGTALRAGAAGLGFAPTRAVLDRLLPAPGTGPSEQTRRTGFFRMDIRTATARGARYRAVVAAQGDPGYAATSVMFGEAALCLVLDRDRLPDRVGILTPATAFGTPLADRLRTAGFEVSVDRL